MDQTTASQIGRIGAHTKWANTPDRTAATAPARAGFLARFEREVDPDGVLTPDERSRRAEHARKAYFARLALKSAEARRRGGRQTTRVPAPATSSLCLSQTHPAILAEMDEQPCDVLAGTPYRGMLKKLVEDRGWQSGSSLEDKVALTLHHLGHRPPRVAQQHRVGKRRLDFAWPDLKVDLEIDGHYHRNEGAPERDKVRDTELQALGWTVFRVDDKCSVGELVRRVTAVVAALELMR